MTLNKPDAEFLHHLADVAEAKILESYLQNHLIEIASKPKEGFRFDPVTNVDRETELMLRRASASPALHEKVLHLLNS